MRNCSTLKSLDFDLGLTGFDSRELSALIDQPNSAEDEVPPVPVAPVSRPGDLWLLGPHRVLCADSTDAGSVARLLGERKPSLLVTRSALWHPTGFGMARSGRAERPWAR